MSPFSGKDINSILNNSCTYIGDETLVFTDCRPILEARQSDLTWIRPGIKKAEYYINNSKAGGIICDQKTLNLFSGVLKDIFFIISENPLLSFTRILKKQVVEDIQIKEGFIHSTAIIHPGCKIGKDVRIGAYSIIDAADIGDYTTISNNVRIYNKVSIGNRCEIREFCSIGGPGFGIVKDEVGNNIPVPHIGNVRIGNGVLIFPFSNVDKGMLGDTVIEDNVAIDHYCHIGHNTFTGSNTIITAGVILAGGAKIQNNCFLGVRTIVKEKIEVGANATTGMGAVVTNNIPDLQTWVGNPACEIGAFIKQREFIKKNI